MRTAMMTFDEFLTYAELGQDNECDVYEEALNYSGSSAVASFGDDWDCGVEGNEVSGDNCPSREQLRINQQLTNGIVPALEKSGE